MKNPPLSRFLSFYGILSVSVICSISPAGAEIDTALNKSVWKMKYGASDAQLSNASWLAGDADGDGMSNQEELDAGANPFKPNSVLQVTSMSVNETSVSMTFPTMAAKVYFAQASAQLSPATWATIVPAVQVVGDGGAKPLVAPKNAGAFFRVLTLSVDQYSATLAKWFGVDNTSMSVVFPNLSRFATPDLGFMS